MKRRKALKNIILVAAGMTAIPACDFTKYPSYGNIPLKKKQWVFIDQISQAILPYQTDRSVPMEGSATHFLLTSINDCYPPEDIGKYISGMNKFQAYVKENYTDNVKNIPPAKLDGLLQFMSQTNDLPEAQKYFFDTTRQLTIRHFTSSEDFMKNEMNFEFAPGRFFGCVEI